MVHPPASIARLLGKTDWGELDTETFLRELAATMAHELDCSRFGVRLAMDTPLGRALKTVVMYDRARRDAIHVPDMIGDDIDAYLATVWRCGGVAVERVHDDGRIPALLLDNAEQCDVHSLLDVAITLNGMVYGTFSAEHVGAEGSWSPHHLELLRRLAVKTAPTLVRLVTEELTRPGELWKPGPSYWLAPVQLYAG